MNMATSTRARPSSRRTLLARMVLAAVALPVAGVIGAGTASADRKTKKQIKQRAAIYKDWCEKGGGTATVTVRPGGTTVACAGSESGNWSCTVTSKSDRCFGTAAPSSSSPVTDAATPPTNGNEQPGDPTQAGGGAGVDPGGGNEQPAAGESGQPAGGGGGVEPGGAEQSVTTGGGVVTPHGVRKRGHAAHHRRSHKH